MFINQLQFSALSSTHSHCPAKSIQRHTIVGTSRAALECIPVWSWRLQWRAGTERWSLAPSINWVHSLHRVSSSRDDANWFRRN